VSQCKHVFDRECIRQYLEVQQLRGHRPECPVCHIEISIDLEQEAVEMDAAAGKKARQGILSRLNLDVSPEVPLSKSPSSALARVYGSAANVAELTLCRIGGARANSRRWLKSSRSSGLRTARSSRSSCA
jgi:hypothetical protein